MLVVDRPANPVEMFGEIKTGEFSIKASAKAFQILSGSLYTNRILAVIRELLCNARDSQVAAKNLDTPIDLQLPTALDPTFSVRDYGTGLSDADVFKLYTTYFESTKTGSNEFVGALGLGSKSPFSYVDNFTVTSWFDGVKSSYCAYINDSGVPSIARLGQEPSDEPQGIQVSFPAREKDFDDFRTNARAFLGWFEFPVNSSVKPETRASDEYKLITSGCYSKQSASHIKVLFGGVTYTVLHSEPSLKNFNLLQHVNLIRCEIGDVDIAPSREALTFTRKTIDFFARKDAEINEYLTNKLVGSYGSPKTVAECLKWIESHVPEWFVDPFSKLPAIESSITSLVESVKSTFVECRDNKDLLTHFRVGGIEVGARRVRVTHKGTYSNGKYTSINFGGLNPPQYSYGHHKNKNLRDLTFIANEFLSTTFLIADVKLILKNLTLKDKSICVIESRDKTKLSQSDCDSLVKTMTDLGANDVRLLSTVLDAAKEVSKTQYAYYEIVFNRMSTNPKKTTDKDTIYAGDETYYILYENLQPIDNAIAEYAKRCDKIYGIRNSKFEFLPKNLRIIGIPKTLKADLTKFSGGCFKNLINKLKPKFLELKYQFVNEAILVELAKLYKGQPIPTDVLTLCGNPKKSTINRKEISETAVDAVLRIIDAKPKNNEILKNLSALCLPDDLTSDQVSSIINIVLKKV